MSETSPKCNRCGVPLPPDAPEGLCPRCLVALNLATQTDVTGEAGPHGTVAGKPPPAPPLPPAEVAKLFPQLEILECLGRGGMGAVYKARQPRLDRLVALKILSPEKQDDPKFAERFEREARALARLSHPNIVTVYDFGQAQGKCYLLMEFVDGLTLRQLFHTRKLAPAEALNIVPKICEALQYAHNEGIVHRDIKPENILLDKKGQVKIADFGIAKIIGQAPKDGSLTGAKDVVGTPHYMAPEQIEKPATVDHRADIYSLGVVFYEMLTGELPLGKFQPPSHKVQVDVRLDEIVLRALEKEPERRYQQASQVKTAVETISNSPGEPAAPAGASLKASPVRDYRTKQSLWGWPLVHVTWGADPATRRQCVAKGWIAVGPTAKGLVAVGLEAYGVMAVGLVAGGVLPTGLLAFGGWAVGLVAYGITATGLLAIALRQAVGLTALGGRSVGLVHFGIDAPVFWVLGLPIVAVWLLRLIYPPLTRTVSPAQKTDYFWRFIVIVFVVIPTLGLLGTLALGNLIGKRHEVPPTTQTDHASEPASLIGQQLKQQVIDAEARIDKQTAQLRELSRLNNDQLRAVMSDIIPDATLQRLLADLDAAQLQLTVLEVTNHSGPKVQQLNDYIAAINRKIDDRVHGLLSGLKAQLESQKAAGRKLQQKLAATNPPPASAETWSPLLAPDEKPDVDKIRQEAQELTGKGQYEEALQRHIWYHNHALQYGTGQTGVRLSFALADWAELGRRYPKAKQALIEIRDRDTQEFAEGRGYFDLFMDVHSLNQYLGEDEATYSLFKRIEQSDPPLARQCFGVSEDLLVSHGEYDLCQGYIGDPQTAFESIRQSREHLKKLEDQWAARRQEQTKQFEQTAKTNPLSANTPAPFLPEPPRLADKKFVGQTRQLIEILVGANRKTDAGKIREEALAVLDVSELQSAVSDAAKKIGKQVKP
jgi:tRNA A-37 threonylcarbamoyl transferase component Bud32